YENTPNVILESFTCGVPVIASNLGGMAELVQDGRGGMLFAPGDARDLARQVERLIADPALLSRLREGIPPVRTVEDEMDELEAIYCQLAAA
ncbi:MAG TPA: glycosyltransferase, partial [Anaerolineaceae bacterium]|nr:glycosyltransferase [Anaerolineaceae bacterium]